VSVVVVATVTPRSDQVDAVRDALLAGEFVMVERWESREALNVHGRAEALTTLGGELAGKLAAPLDVRRLAPVPAGDARKGAV